MLFTFMFMFMFMFLLMYMYCIRTLKSLPVPPLLGHFCLQTTKTYTPQPMSDRLTSRRYGKSSFPGIILCENQSAALPYSCLVGKIPVWLTPLLFWEGGFGRVDATRAMARVTLPRGDVCGFRPQEICAFSTRSASGFLSSSDGTGRILSLLNKFYRS